MQPKPLDPKQDRKKLPLPRLPRAEFGMVEDGESQAWAVSYADLLMVLMSFFIIFFSFSDTKSDPKADGLLAVAMGFSKVMPELAPVAKPGQPKTQETRKPSAVVDTGAMTALGASVSESGKFLYIQLPDDIFPKRKFTLDGATETKLAELYRVLADKQAELEIIVIGHSDSSRVSGSTNPYLANNFDLSSLRALRALQYLVSLGFPQSNISAQASADGVRNSRSISVRIQLKEPTT